MKPIVLCIIGNSGSGKTTLANYLEDVYAIPMIRSYTDRPPRYEGEDSHTFVTKEEFEKFDIDDMTAHTIFGGNNYCCFHKDIQKGWNTYVIDENGYLYMITKFSDKYDIIGIKVLRDEIDVDGTRIGRDDGRFLLPDIAFNYIIDNDGNLDDFMDKIDGVIFKIGEGFKRGFGGCQDGRCFL